MEVDGVKRVLFKVIIPSVAIGMWLFVCYLVCRLSGKSDLFLYWILAGFPFGMRKMCLWLIPRNFGIGESVGVLALNGIIGGLIGGMVLIFKIIGIAWELVRLIAKYFWTNCPKVESRLCNLYFRQYIL